MSWKIRLTRLPANLISNRLWILWGGSLYIRSRATVVSPVTGDIRGTKDEALAFTTYVRWRALHRPTRIDRRHVAIIPTELGMFGNMIRRMANAVLLAESLNLGHLVVPEGIIFYRGLLREGLSYSRKGISIWFGVAPTVKQNNIDALVTVNLFRSFPTFESLSKESLRDSWDVLRGLLVPPIPAQSSGANTLTIHVRGGDVFSARKPAGYGQPPFSYYKLILESRRWEKVDLVYQDLTNPVSRLIVAHCKKQKIPISTHSSDLPTDLTRLLGAENLVAGRGSFIPAIVGLSPHCKTVYYFEDKMNLIPSVPDITVLRVRDAKGEYRAQVLSNNWENSLDQRMLMTTYPGSSLVMEPS